MATKRNCVVMIHVVPDVVLLPENSWEEQISLFPLLNAFTKKVQTTQSTPTANIIYRKCIKRFFRGKNRTIYMFDHLKEIGKNITEPIGNVKNWMWLARYSSELHDIFF